jgi:hypothetical protein
VVRSATDADIRNDRVSFKSDVQELFKLLNIMSSSDWKDSHQKYESNRIRSKADHKDQHVGSRTCYTMNNEFF